MSIGVGALTILIHTSRLCQMIIVWSHLCGVHLSPLEGIRKEIRGWILYRMRIGIEQIDNGTRYSLHDPLSQNCEPSSGGIMPGRHFPPLYYGVTSFSHDDFTSLPISRIFGVLIDKETESLPAESFCLIVFTTSSTKRM